MTNAVPNSSSMGDSEKDLSHPLDGKRPEPLPVSNGPKLSSPFRSPTTSNHLASDAQDIAEDVADEQERTPEAQSAKSAGIHENGDEPYRRYMGGSADVVCVTPRDNPLSSLN